ncbi:helix-turn-helix domain-containing protein [Phycisphaerales bacterium AB-hyl4]|uniref:Helix-turn-helix domain-containing protein n=1 Tax=Natronomicrosphaera hydrolytica TaxID=3242702 RepID=A0ABV4U2W6_9BACT
MSKLELNNDALVRLDHGLSADRPIVTKHDLWPEVGPGMQDMHYEVELGIVMRGRMAHRNRHWVGEFGPGDVWLTGIWEPHSAEITEVPLELCMFHIYPPMLAQWKFPEYPDCNWLSFFTAPPEERPQQLSNRGDIWLDIARQVLALTPDQDRFDQLLLRPLLMRFLTELGRVWPGFEATSSIRVGTYEHIGRAIAAVFETPHRLSVTEGADLAGMNRNVFTEKFQELMGMSFAEFSLKHRLYLASHALRETDLPLKAIATHFGFTDKSHLHRSFVRLFGQTPHDYRRSNLRPVAVV